MRSSGSGATRSGWMCREPSRSQQPGDRRQEKPACPPKPPDRRSLGGGGWRRRESLAAFLQKCSNGPASRLAESSRSALDSLLTVLLAPACPLCQTLLDRPTRGLVCPACWDAVPRLTPPVCDRCGDPLPSWRVISQQCVRCPRCRRSPSALDRGRAVGPYESTLRRLVHLFKYDRRHTLAAPLGTLMRQHGTDLLADADCVVPVPLHPRRRRARGFNQAAELAAHLGPPVVHALRRTVATPPPNGPTRGTAPWERPGGVCAGPDATKMERAGGQGRRAAGRLCRAGRRRRDNRGHARSVCPRATWVRRCRSAGAHAGESRSPRIALISAAMSALSRSPSTRTQPACSA